MHDLQYDFYFETKCRYLMTFHQSKKVTTYVFPLKLNMKFLKYALLASTLIFASCSDDDGNAVQEFNANDIYFNYIIRNLPSKSWLS